jgi:hypothetical protein
MIKRLIAGADSALGRRSAISLELSCLPPAPSRTYS